MGEYPHCGPTLRSRTRGTRLSSTSHHPNYLKPPAFGQGAPLRQPARLAEAETTCPPAPQSAKEHRAFLLTRSLEPCPGRLPAPAGLQVPEPQLVVRRQRQLCWVASHRAAFWLLP